MKNLTRSSKTLAINLVASCFEISLSGIIQKAKKPMYGLLAFLFLVLCFQSGWSQLLQWNTFGNAGTETTEPSVFNATGISAANLTLGAGVTAAGNANRFGGNAWFDTGDTNPTTLAESVAGNDYIEFVVTPTGGYSFTPTSLVFGFDRSSTGPSTVALRSSVDGYTNNIGTPISVPASQSNGNTFTITGLTGLTTPTTFRLYGYGATAAAGTGGYDVTTNVVNVSLNGTSCISPTVTSPPTDQTTCQNGNAQFIASFTGGDPAPTLTWQVQVGMGSFTDLTNTAPYSGVNTNTLTITNTPFSLNGNHYRLKANNTCGDVFTNPALLTVTALGTIICPPPYTTEWIAGFNMAPVGPNTPQDPSVAPGITGTPTTTNNCGQPFNFTYQDVLVGPTPANCPNLWTLNRTWTATDAFGNTSTCVQVMTFTDTTNPSFTSCPAAPIQLPCSTPPDQALAISSAGPATDNCGTPTITTNSGDIVDVGCTHTQTWNVVATDNCGNQATCTVVFTWVTDTEDPVFNDCPTSAITLSCNATVTEAQAIDEAGTASDDCGNLEYSAVGGAVDVVGCTATQTWTVTATDACGNTATCSVTFTWTSDTTPPTVTCPPTFAGNYFNGFNLSPVGINTPQDPSINPMVTGTPTTSDNCGMTSVNYQDVLTTTACPNPYTVLRTWTVLDNCGNTSTCVQTINLNVSNPTCPADFSICLFAPPVALTGGTPTGGTYSGAGVSSNTFNPSVAGVGPHTITYTYTVGACNYTCTFVITVLAAPLVSCPVDFAVCVNSAPFTLTGGSPVGGVYSGPGVSAGMFDPAVAGVGVKVITYTVTGGNGCTASCSFNITVNPQPVVICPPAASVCLNAPAFALTGASPAGGIYSGAGVSGGIFTASVAGVGPHLITYLYTNPVTNCANACTFTITVKALPVVTCPPSTDVCIDEPAFALTGGSPAGGTYSGTGVSMGNFNASSAGVGNHTITYTYTDPMTLCTNTCTFDITVNALPVVTCPANSAVTITTPPYALTGGSPSGGNYSGAGVSMNTFNPNTAGLGPHVITYTYTNGATGCTNSCTFTITVNPDDDCVSGMEWVYLPPGFQSGSCTSGTNCCTNTICYGLQYTPENTGLLTDYTTGFFVPCFGGNSPVISNVSCVMNDNSFEINGCASDNLVLFNSSGNQGTLPVTACQPVIIHQVCFTVNIGTTFQILEDTITNLSTSIEVSPTLHVFEFPEYTVSTVTRTAPVPPMDQASTVACPVLAVPPGYPVVLDQCGSPIPAVLFSTVNTPDPLTCEGTRVYTYKYTECSGYMFNWKYTYTIERNDFTVPANGSTTVACAQNAVPANIPVPTVLSNCLENIVPTGPFQDANESDTYDGCNGTISYTYNYADCEGNNHDWTYTFNVVNTPPVAICQNITVQLDEDGLATIIPSQLNNGSTDACGQTLTFSANNTLFDCGDIGNVVVTLTVTDFCGLSSTCTSTVTVQDNLPPTVICKNTTVYLDNAGMATITTADVVVSSDDNCGVISTTLSNSNFNCSNLCANTLDQSYQQSTGTFGPQPGLAQTFTAGATGVLTKVRIPAWTGSPTLTVEILNGGNPNASPVIATATIPGPPAVWKDVYFSMPPNVIMGNQYTIRVSPGVVWVGTVAGAYGGGNLWVNFGGGYGSIPSWDADFETFVSACNPVTVTVTDGSGNTGTCVANVVVVDLIPPTLSCPPSSTATCSINEVPAYPTLAAFLAAGGMASDNCAVNPNSFVLISQGSDLNTCPETIVRVYGVSDFSGNSTTCSQVIIVDDNIPPTFNPNCNMLFDYYTSNGSTCPSSSLLSLVEGQVIGQFDTYMVGNNTVPALGLCIFDNCDASPSARVDDIQQTDDGTCVRHYVVTFTIIDDCANESTSPFICMVNVFDDTPPVVTPPNGFDIECSGLVPAAAGTITEYLALPGASISDNCQAQSGWTISSNTTFSGTECNGSYTRTYTISDGCGNYATSVQIITVSDNTAPVITCSPNITVSTDPGQCSACDVTITSLPIVPTNPAIPFADRLSTYSNVSINGGGNAAYVTGGSTVNLSFNQITTFPGSYCPGCVVQIYVGIGGSTTTINCVSFGQFSYPVNNNFAGSFTAPSVPGTYYLTQNGSLQFSCVPINFSDDPSFAIGVIVVGDVPYASDNCTEGVTVTSNEPECFSLGTTVVTFTAIDDCGNSSTCTQLVTVTDTQAPTITCPIDIVQGSDPEVCGAVVNWTPPTASDNCSPACPSNSIPGYNFLGSLHGHKYFVSLGTADWATAKASAQSLGGHLVTFTNAAESGFVANLASYEKWIGMTDELQEGTWRWINGQPFSYTNWSVGEPNNLFGEDYGEQYAIPGQWNDLDGTGLYPYIVEFDCIVPEQIGGPVAGSTFPVGTTLITYIVEDGSGNTATCTFNVTVNDDDAPIITTCPPTETYEGCNVGAIPVLPFSAADVTVTAGQFGQAGGVATDNCAVTSYKYHDTQAGTCPIVVTRTWTVADAAGNTTTCTQTINVDDTTPPTFNPECLMLFNYYTSSGSTCPAVSYLSLHVGDVITQFQPYFVGNNTVPALGGCIADNCDPSPDALVVSIDSTVVGGCERHYIVSFRIVDDCGNQSVDPFICMVNVFDNTPPVITCPANVTIECDADSSPANTGTATATDNCQTGITITSSDLIVAGSCPQTYTIQRIWTANDGCGNSSTCTQTINVRDITAPVITCSPNITVSADEGECQACDVTITSLPIVPTNPAIPFADRLSTYSNVSINGGSNAAHVTGGSTVNLSFNQVTTFPGSYCPGCIVQIYVGIGGSTTTINCVSFGFFSYPVNNNFAGSFTAPSVAGTYYLTQNGSLQFSCIPMNFSDDPSFAIGVIVVDDMPYASDNCSEGVLVTSNEPECFPVGTTVVTFTATDACGNTATCTQTVTVEDDQAPTITCPANITEDSDPGICGAVVSYDLPTTSDNCAFNCPESIPGYTNLGSFDGHRYFLYNTSATWTAANAAATALGGHLATITSVAERNFLIGGVGSQDPWIGLSDAAVEGTFVWVNGEPLVYTNWAGGEPNNAFGTEDYVIMYSGNGQWNDLTNTEDTLYIVEFECGLPVQIAGLASGSTFPVGVTTNVFQITDNAGNTATCSFTVTVVDDESPLITTCPPTVTYEGCNVGAIPVLPFSAADVTVSAGQFTTAGGVATDNCAVTSYKYHDTQAGTCPIVVTRTWTVADAAGNTTTCTQTINVDDTTPPTFDPECLMLFNYYTSSGSTCPAVSYLSLHVGSVITQNQPYFVGNNTVPALGGCIADNCDPSPDALVVSIDSTVVGGCERHYVVSFRIVDDCGNQSVDPFICMVNVFDNTPPVITCPANVTIECDADSSPANTGTATATDNCQTGIAITSSDVIVAGSCPQTYTIQRIWTANDGCGNSSTCTQTINVRDITAPVITCSPNITVSADEGECQACDVTITSLPIVPTNPAIPFADRLSTYSNVSINGGGNATHVTGGSTVNLSFNQVTTFPGSYCPGCIVQIYVGIGGSTTTINCVSFGFFSYPVNNNFAGSFTAPSVAGTYYLTQNGSLQFSCIPMNFSDDPSFAIGVIVVDDMPYASDNCSEGVLVTSNEPECFPVGTTVVTFTATDACGNTATCTQTVTVEDDQAPTITCPANITEDSDPGICGAVVSYDLPTTSDNCAFNCPESIAGYTNLGSFDGHRYFLYNTSATWTAANAAATALGGHLATITSVAERNFLIGGVGSQDPWIGLSDAAVEGTFVWVNGEPLVYTNWAGGEPNNAFGTEDYVIMYSGNGQWNDLTNTEDTLYIVEFECGLPVQIAGLASGSTFPVGVTTNVFQITDNAGNTATCSFTVTVVDDESPLITTCPPTVTYEGCNVGAIPVLPFSAADVTVTASQFGQAGGVATDNCAVTSYKYHDTQAGTCPIVVTRTWTVADAAGNTTTCTQTINVDDTTPPTFNPECLMLFNYYTSSGSTCPAVSYLSLHVGDVITQFQPYFVGNNTVPALGGCIADNCDPSPDALVVSIDSTVVGGCERHYIVSFRIVDDCGNQSVDPFICMVNVFDNTPPVITCPANVTIECDADSSPANTGTATATDNCQTGITITSSDLIVAGSCPQTYTIQRIWTANDGCGNSSTCTQTINVRDITAPVITCSPNITVSADEGECQACDVTITSLPIVPTNPAIPFADRLSTYSNVSINGGGNATHVTGGSTVNLSFNQVTTFPGSYCPGCIVQIYVGIGGSTTTINCVSFGFFSYPVNNNFAGSFTAPSVAGTYYLTQNGSLQFSCIPINFSDDPSFAIGVIVVDDMPYASDNCSEGVLVTSNEPECFPVGTTVVTFTATDACGNTATCTQTVTVEDDQAPTITCPANITEDSDPGICGAVVSYDLPTTSDNCAFNCPESIAGYTNLGSFDGHRYFLYNTSATWTAANAAATALGGHLATITSVAERNFLIGGVGSQDPWIGLSDAAVEGTFVWVNGEPLVYTNWAGGEPNNAFGTEDYVIMYSGNGQWNDLTNTEDTLYIVEFECGQPVQIAGLASGSTFPVGVTTNVFQITDNAGNTATCSFTVTVVDDESPVITTCPPTQTYLGCNVGAIPVLVYSASDVTVSAGQFTTAGGVATDNCAVTSYKYHDTQAGTCPIVVTRTWTVSDAAGNTTTCTQTIIIQKPDFTLPPNGASTVACANLAVQPIPPTVTDACGTPIIPTGPTQGGTYQSCEGTITYTWNYTDCAGHSHNWTYTYTIEREDFTVPGPDIAFVECASQVVVPVPPAVNDNCGNPIQPSGPFINVDYQGCEGTISYTWFYTDCEGNSHTWTFFYIIDHVTNPTQMGGPVPTASTIPCPANAVPPVLPMVKDVCGTLLAPKPFPPTVPSPVTLNYADRQVTYTGVSINGGGNVMTVAPGSSVNLAYNLSVAFNPITGYCPTCIVETYIGIGTTGQTLQCEVINPPSNGYSNSYSSGSFIAPSTPGLYYLIQNGTLDFVCQPQFFINSMNRAIGAIIVGGTYNGCEGTIPMIYHYEDCSGLPFEWNYIYTVERLDFTLPVNGSSTVQCVADAVQPTPPTVTDNCGNVLTPTGPVTGGTYEGCEGTKTYTWHYVDCEGNNHDWVYTYTIDHTTAPSEMGGPVSTASTVPCPANATAPALPMVKDVCGNILLPQSFPPVVPSPVTLTYYDRQVTYTGVSINGGSNVATVAPGSSVSLAYNLSVFFPGGGYCPTCIVEIYVGIGTTSQTLQCNIINPPSNGYSNSFAGSFTAPTQPGIYYLIQNGTLDYVCQPQSFTNSMNNAIGVIVVGGTYDGCEGTIPFSYHYEDCSGLPFEWNYIYTVERLDFTLPVNGSSTVQCVADAVQPTPPTVTDNCGNVLTPTGPVTGGTYEGCEGTKTYTWHYVDCEGNNHDWVYTYTIDHTTAPSEMGGPVSTASTVPCPANATAPTLPMVKDVCGNILLPQSFPPVVPSPVTLTYYDRQVTYTGVSINGGSNTATVAPGSSVSLAYNLSVFFPGGGYCPTCIVEIYVGIGTTNQTLQCNIINPPSNGYSNSFAGSFTAPTQPGIYYLIQNGTLDYVCQPQSFTNSMNNAIGVIVVGGTYDGCEGTIPFSYHYEDCSGLPFEWNYIYTVERLDFTLPVNGSSTVQCGADAVQPTPPTVTDNCGNVLTPTGPVMGGTYEDCEGTKTYTWHYVDCEGNNHDWVYTYTIDHTTAPAEMGEPVSTSSTVACILDATPPSLPMVKDVCGNILIPEAFPPVVPSPVTLTYYDRQVTYTGVSINGGSNVATVAPGSSVNLAYNLSVFFPGGGYCPTCIVEIYVGIGTTSQTLQCNIINPPSNGYSNSFAGSFTAPTQPGIYYLIQNGTLDYVCQPQNYVNSMGAAIGAIIVGGTYDGCEGTIAYNYHYEDCAGLPFDWTYTYDVQIPDFTIAIPTQFSVIPCAADAIPENVTLNNVFSFCGDLLDPIGPVINQYGTDTYDGCAGTTSFTWTYEDCAGDIHPFTYTFDIEPTAPTLFGDEVPNSSIINCYLEAAPPILVPGVMDACGNILAIPTPTVGGTNTGNCGGTITYTYSFTACNGAEFDWVYTYYIVCDPIVLHVWLEGAYNLMGDTMRTTMNTLHTLPGQNAPPFYIDYPAGQPYSLAPWLYNGNPGTQWGDFMGQTPYPADVVDWVLVMIRKNGLLPMHTIWTCAGWVHKDGKVTFPENCPLPAFSTTDLYYFVVQHRNHLGVLSPTDTDMPCGTAQLEWDFRNSNSYQPVFRFGQKQVEPGVWAMFGANGEQVGSIQSINSLDRTLWRSLQGTFGYTLGDFELDADTDSADENLWKLNQNRTSGVIFY